MASVLTETDAFGATVTVPDDTDTGVAASVNVGFQEVTNRTRYLYNRGIGQYVPIPLNAMPSPNFTGDGSDEWIWNNVTGGIELASDVAQIALWFEIPSEFRSANISEVHLVLTGDKAAASAHGAPPGNHPTGNDRPGIQLYDLDLVTLGAIALNDIGGGVTYDSIAGTSPYDDVHLISKTGLTIAPNPSTKKLMLRVLSETGTGVINALTVMGAYMKVD